MKYLLDTCIISEVVRSNPNQNVTNWLQSQDEQNLYLSVLTFGEIKKGIEKMAAGEKKSKLELWLENDLKQRFKGRILSVDMNTCNQWGVAQAQAESVGKPLPSIDGLIAACALANNCIVVTRNTKDMQQGGVELINPWGL